MPDINFTDQIGAMLPKHVTVHGFAGQLKAAPMPGAHPTAHVISVHMYGPVAIERHPMMKMTEAEARAYVAREVTKGKLGLARLMDEMAMELRKGS